MDAVRKQTRQWLIDANRRDFEDIIYKAKITPRQQTIIEMRILKNIEIFKIAQTLNLSERAIQADIKKAYDLISNILTVN